MGGWAFYVYVTVIASDTRPFDGLVSFSLTSTGSVLLSRSPRRNHGDGYAERRSKPDAAFIVEGVRGEGSGAPVLSFSFERHVPFVLACRRGPSCVFSALFRHSDNGSITCFTFTLTDGGPVLLFYGKFSVFFVCVYACKKKSSGELPTFVHFWRLGATHQIKEAYFWNAVNVIISFNWMKLFRYR